MRKYPGNTKPQHTQITCMDPILSQRLGTKLCPHLSMSWATTAVVQSVGTGETDNPKSKQHAVLRITPFSPQFPPDTHCTDSRISTALAPDPHTKTVQLCFSPGDQSISSLSSPHAVQYNTQLALHSTNRNSQQKSTWSGRQHDTSLEYCTQTLRNALRVRSRTATLYTYRLCWPKTARLSTRHIHQADTFQRTPLCCYVTCVSS